MSDHRRRGATGASPYLGPLLLGEEVLFVEERWYRNEKRWYLARLVRP